MLAPCPPVGEIRSKNFLVYFYRLLIDRITSFSSFRTTIKLLLRRTLVRSVSLLNKT